MKSEHRHELKTNELAEWIANFPAWLKENSRTIVIVAAVIIAGVVFYIYSSYQKNVVKVKKQTAHTSQIRDILNSGPGILQAQTQGYDISYNLLQSAEKLRTTARDAKNDQMAAIALIKSADALRMELHFRPGSPSGKEVAVQIEKARNLYSEAAAKASNNISLFAKAQLGLGLCAEELGDFDQAGIIYQGLGANPDLQVTVAAKQAKIRLNTMADYQKKLVFPPAPARQQTAEDIPSQSAGPTLESAAATDFNLPTQ